MKKRWLSALLIGALCVSLAGCQKDGGEETSTAPDSTEMTGSQEESESATETTKETIPETTKEASQRPGASGDDVVYTDIYYSDFEAGTTDFTGRSAETIEVIEGEAYEGAYCLRVSNRTSSWNGMKLDVTEKVQVQQKYYVSAYVKYIDGNVESQRIYIKMDYNNGESYLTVGSVLCTKGEWSKVEGYIEIPAGATSVAFYTETEYTASDPDYLIDLYMDNFYVQEIYANSNAADLPSLYERHVDYFKVGVAIGPAQLANAEAAAVITQHFNTMTMGNEMKPENILDYDTCASDPEKYNLEPAVKFDAFSSALQFAQENNMLVRGHVLVWHSQTPRWFFTENYSKDASAPLASKEVMLARMESYIEQVLTYVQTEFPGVVYCWDVVNEAINVGDGEEGGYRSADSYWYQTIGPEFVEMAFTYARQYADPEVKLFYNDYNCYDKMRMFAMLDMLEPLVEKGLVDGMGLQSHIDMTTPSTIDFEYTINKFAQLGLEIHITELDIKCTDNSVEGQLKLAKRYKRIMNTLYRIEQNGTADITNVTVWGLTDDTSWLSGDETHYPLLFNSFLQAKEAFWGFFRDPSVTDW